MIRKFATLSILALAGCAQAPIEADLLVYNARVYTADSAFTMASAFAVKDGRFLEVGTSESIRSKYTAPGQVDAAGQTIVPGLIDAHCHFFQLGLNQEVIDLAGTRSFEEVLERVLDLRDRNQPAYLYGRGWDQNDWGVREFPDKSALDSLFPDIPVALERIDGHALLANQKALDLGGIDATTRVPGGEVLLRDGLPTGILIDNPKNLVLSRWPQPSRAAQVRALLAAQAICFENGLTTVNDAGLERATIELIDSLQQAGALTIRVYAMVSNTPADLDHYLARGPYETDRLTVRSVKVYADGALGSRGAALKRPYTDRPGHYGAMITPSEDLAELAGRIASAGFQMNTHAIGDSASVAVLRAYREALAGAEDPRWKVEHAQIVEPSDLEFFGPQVLPSVQPTHATSDMYWAENRLGPDRMAGAYAYASLLEASGVVVLGTDFPVEQVDPIQTFYAAVTRQDRAGYPAGGFMPAQALTREQALKGMTRWAAYSNFEEADKGSIEAGKWADFTVLSGDLMELPADSLKDVRIRQTFVSGRQVY
ncbi:MAG TPA: amidohydrolase [Robiginitalea sp.]|nr:amidohydrolase [Robiginitalea sp.]